MIPKNLLERIKNLIPRKILKRILRKISMTFVKGFISKNKIKTNLSVRNICKQSQEEEIKIKASKAKINLSRKTTLSL